ncbi:MAG TPA: TfoX/Sxy family protein [Nannocystis sp.]
MASSREFLDFVLDQLRGVGGVSTRKMFGEYAIYVGNKVVAFVCDDRLFLKPTAAGRALIGTPVEEPIFPGSKLYFVADDYLDDPDFLSRLVLATAAEVAEPKPKKRKGR